MPTSVNAVPPGLHTLTPHLTVRGASDYIEFLKRAFGAIEQHRSPGPDGRLMHAAVQIGDSVLMLNDDFPEFGASPIADGHWPLTLHLYVPDADATFAQSSGSGMQGDHAAGGPVLGGSLRPCQRPIRFCMGHCDA